MTHSTAPAAHAASPRSAGTSLARVGSLAFGVTTYALFLGTFLYVIGFLAGVVVPKDINAGPAGAVSTALLVNGGFLALFAVQHTIMARRAFKARWTRVVPAHLERSVFVLVTCAILVGMVAAWRPLPGTVWHVEGAAAWALWTASATGWGVVLVSTFLIDHFELFGVRQTVEFALGRPQSAPRFVERSLYRVVRHPLMLGFLLAFWATPHMTWGHLFFAGMCTAYILVGVQVEERTLVAAHGDDYLDYKRRVPGILPLPRRRA